MNRIKLLQVHQVPHTRFLEDTLKSGFYAEGPKVLEFEKQLTPFVGNEFAVAVNSGTAALYLALYMAGVREGKAVITTPMTSPATNISIPRLQGSILWADVDAASGNICPKSVKKLLDKYGDQVVAVIAVDWGGMPCDFDALRGRLAGSYADFTCFSFQAVKHITTGDGGLLTVLNKNICRRAQRLRWFGIDRGRPGRAFDDDLTEAGFKFHMNDVAASIGLAQLEVLPGLIKRRREIAKYYESELKDFDFQKVRYKAKSAYWLFTMKFEDRKSVIAAMDKNGIDASPLHCRNDTYTAFVKATLGRDHLLNTAKFDEQMLCIPVGEWLSEDDAERVVSTIRKG